LDRSGSGVQASSAATASTVGHRRMSQLRRLQLLLQLPDLLSAKAQLLHGLLQRRMHRRCRCIVRICALRNACCCCCCRGRRRGGIAPTRRLRQLLLQHPVFLLHGLQRVLGGLHSRGGGQQHNKKGELAVHKPRRQPLDHHSHAGHPTTGRRHV
jgi:hypothetical protein